MTARRTIYNCVPGTPCMYGAKRLGHACNQRAQFGFFIHDDRTELCSDHMLVASEAMKGLNELFDAAARGDKLG